MLSCNNPESGRWRGNVHPTVATVHSTATETPALHVEPGRLNATCVEHTTQMASFGARSIIRAATIVNRTTGIHGISSSFNATQQPCAHRRWIQAHWAKPDSRLRSHRRGIVRTEWASAIDTVGEW
jgi:hypothetical protein